MFVSNLTDQQPVIALPQAPAPPSPDQVRDQLDRLMTSPQFRNTRRLLRFLQFVVSESLQHREDKLKEYTIGVEVFDKKETFDPRLDSAVRVCARTLRAKLDDYYATEGAQDDVIIRLRAGDYVPRFYVRSLASLNSIDGSEVYPAIESDPDMRTVDQIADALDAMCYPIAKTTQSLDTALATVGEVGSSLLIVGLGFGELDGGLDRIRAARLHHDAAIICIGSQIDQRTADALAQIGCDTVIYKPVRPGDISSSIRLALARRKFSGRPQASIAQ